MEKVIGYETVLSQENNKWEYFNIFCQSNYAKETYFPHI